MALILAWNDEQDILPISPKFAEKLEELLKLAGEEEGVEDGEVALTFVDDETIHELNRTYRNIDRPTDVLSFAMLEQGEDEPAILYGEEEPDEDTAGDDAGADEEEGFEEPLGDIVISVPRAAAQAEEYGHSVERELGFLFVHGFLHLIGYDHDNEEAEREMFAKQEKILQKAGLTR
ncbi:rRNA maturation RNase YbeY [Paenibacillus sp. UNC499MF]|uniref:rRNA maturation RNase YbeY n=1 Tax=Paenibacillus sp. UNC499MF TaxID=1502751 RepID=UPI0008A02A9D|nr:rRNA maturation RNase YbeY [Paenibacillus sp. UNC499MF]SEF50129.1 probable rRNA maturation factor [Paenibacillus sp. UNC499MF]